MNLAGAPLSDQRGAPHDRAASESVASAGRTPGEVAAEVAGLLGES